MVPSLYIRYEHGGVDFVLPTKMIEGANLIGETNGRDVSSLPHKSGNDNWVYDRSKKFC